MEKEIVKIVCKVTGVSVRELMSQRRTQRISDARHIAAFELHRYGLNMLEVGDALHRHYTTIIHSLHCYHEQMQFNRRFRDVAEKITTMIASRTQ